MGLIYKEIRMLSRSGGVEALDPVCSHDLTFIFIIRWDFVGRMGGCVGRGGVT